MNAIIKLMADDSASKLSDVLSATPPSIVLNTALTPVIAQALDACAYKLLQRCMNNSVVLGKFMTNVLVQVVQRQDVRAASELVFYRATTKDREKQQWRWFLRVVVQQLCGEVNMDFLNALCTKMGPCMVGCAELAPFLIRRGMAHELCSLMRRHPPLKADFDGVLYFALETQDTAAVAALVSSDMMTAWHGVLALFTYALWLRLPTSDGLSALLERYVHETDSFAMHLAEYIQDSRVTPRRPAPVSSVRDLVDMEVRCRGWRRIVERDMHRLYCALDGVGSMYSQELASYLYHNAATSDVRCLNTLYTATDLKLNHLETLILSSVDAEKLKPASCRRDGVGTPSKIVDGILRACQTRQTFDTSRQVLPPEVSASAIHRPRNPAKPKFDSHPLCVRNPSKPKPKPKLPIPARPDPSFTYIFL
jgi:hypothetical protein